MKPNFIQKHLNKPRRGQDSVLSIQTQKFQLGSREYPVTIKRKPFSRSLSLRLKPVPGDIMIYVSAPKALSVSAVLEYVREKSAWLEKHLVGVEQCSTRTNPVPTHAVDPKFLKQAALEYLTERVGYFENIYQLFSTKIETRKFTARWGSCDRQGVLKFNYQLMLLPKPIIDYIVVHEICHLKELNHGPRFWKLVAQEIPDYAKRRKWLRQNQLRIISSLP